MHELNIPEIVAEVTAAFERYDNGLAENDVAVLNDSFWEHALTLRYGIAENLRSHAEIAGFRAGAGAALEGAGCLPLGGDALFHVLGIESLVEHRKTGEIRSTLSGFFLVRSSH